VAETLWQWRLDLAVAQAQNTQTNRDALCDCLANNGSFATRLQEANMFNSVVRLSVSGELPVQAFGLTIPVKQDMRDCFEQLLNGLSSARWFAVRVSDDTLLLTNSAFATVGTPDWSRADSLQAINDERIANSQQPLLIIPEDTEI
jgi:hypothetical protein